MCPCSAGQGVCVLKRLGSFGFLCQERQSFTFWFKPFICPSGSSSNSVLIPPGTPASRAPSLQLTIMAFYLIHCIRLCLLFSVLYEIESKNSAVCIGHLPIASAPSKALNHCKELSKSILKARLWSKSGLFH